MGDAVSIEWALDRLLGRSVGSRGGPNDADVFRLGDPKSLAIVLEQAAEAIVARASAIGLLDGPLENGSLGARIESAADSLRREATELKKKSKEEGETYQWRVIGDLISIVAALLESHEASESS